MAEALGNEGQLAEDSPVFPEPVSTSGQYQEKAKDVPRITPTATLPYGLPQDLGPFPGIAHNVSSPSPLDSDNLLASRSLDAFYTYFFPAHPFVLPQSQLIYQHDTDPSSVSEVIVLIALIGSLYIHDEQSTRFRQNAEGLLEKRLPPTGFTVQALMLLALCLEWSGEGQRAGDVLEGAKAMALDLGMNRKSFAVDHGREDSTMQESWRRTWWELYIIDALFAGIRHWPAFSLWKVEADADIPAEEKYYITGNIPRPRTLQNYDDRFFQENDDPFSSFTYLIDAARILGTALAAGDIAGGSPSSLVKNAEANILSWDLYLPQNKRDPVRPDRTVDEVLFRAHLMINTVAIHLHRPRSALHYSTMELLCSRYAPPLPAEVIPAEEKQPDRHTHGAIRAAESFVDLLSAPSPPMRRTPFVMCMGSMAVATHLSACEYRLSGSEFVRAKDRVRAFLGVLKAFRGVWGQAGKWEREIRTMARVVFEGRDASEQLILDSSTATDGVAAASFVEESAGSMDLWQMDDTMEDVIGGMGIIS